MSHSVDILNLEWETDSRDTNIVDPVLCSLSDRYNYSIKCGSVWYFLFKLLYYRPKVLLISNDSGSLINVNVFKFANMLGIKTISMISEGLHYKSLEPDMQKEFNSLLFWGNNVNKINYTDLRLIWSNSFRNEIFRDVQYAENYNIKVTGATGFDRYILLKEKGLLDGFENEIFKKYNHTVLLVGYGFDILKNALDNSSASGVKDEELLSRCSHRTIVRDIYETIISHNPNTIFILKHHPGSDDIEYSEFEGLDKYENTIVYHKNIDMTKLVCVSDLVIAYESTVCMEAWILGKTTVLVNPKGTCFTRSNLHEGSVIVENSYELQKLLDEFYMSGNMLVFDKLRKKREEILTDQIQFCDGFNYLRSAKIINDYILASANKKRCFDLILLTKELLSEIKDFLIEKTVLGMINKNGREIRKKRSVLYDKETRMKRINKYKEAIYAFESHNGEKVQEICDNYTG